MMKKVFFILFLLGMISLTGFSQIEEKGTPLAIKYGLNVKNVDVVTLPAPDVDALLAQDAERAKEGKFYRVGVAIKTNLTPDNSGTWTTAPDGHRIWRIRIHSDGAEALVLNFDKFHLPLRAKLFAYTSDGAQVIGAFTSKNNRKDKKFGTRMVLSDDIIVELDMPAKSVKGLELSINEVGYIYRSVGAFLWKSPKPAGACEVNVNCSPEGGDWQDEKRGVARILLKAGSQ